MHERSKRLRALMAAHGLSAADVGEMVGVNAQTVRVWRVKSNTRVIPETSLRLLELTLQTRGKD